MVTTAPAPLTLPRTAAHHVVPRVLGAALALAVAYIHVKDQGGLLGLKTPTYVGIGYYLLEIAGVVAAVALLLRPGRHTVQAWLLSIGIAVGPVVGFVLSRGPGLPNYVDDKGNWTETLGLVALTVEGLLLVLAVTVLARSRRVKL